jgi:hypothetical protein
MHLHILKQEMDMYGNVVDWQLLGIFLYKLLIWENLVQGP